MTDLRKLLDEATPGPWGACKGGKCSCGIVWSKPHDHPVASAQNTPWGDEVYTADPTEDDPTNVRRDFMDYGSFPVSEFHANARLIALAPDLAAALLKAEKVLEPLDDVAQSRAADAPEWRDHDTVSVSINIGDLRRARATLTEIRKLTGAK